MLKTKSSEKLFYLVVGAIIASTCFLLIGATDVSAPNYGRYQISAWSAPTGRDAIGVGAFVLDTATGETKLVFNKTITPAENGLYGKDQRGKPFYAIK